jgi:hypothetical protein
VFPEKEIGELKVGKVTFPFKTQFIWTKDINLLRTCKISFVFLSSNCGLDVRTGTSIFLLMPRSSNSTRIELILFVEQPRI